VADGTKKPKADEPMQAYVFLASPITRYTKISARNFQVSRHSASSRVGVEGAVLATLCLPGSSVSRWGLNVTDVAHLLPRVQDNDVRGGVRTEDNGAVTVGDLVRDAYAKDTGVAAHAVKMGIETNVMHELCHVLHQVRAALGPSACMGGLACLHLVQFLCSIRVPPQTIFRCMQVVNPDTYWLLTESKVTPIQALTVRRGAGHCEFFRNAVG